MDKSVPAPDSKGLQTKFIQNLKNMKIQIMQRHKTVCQILFCILTYTPFNGSETASEQALKLEEKTPGVVQFCVLSY